MSAPGRSARRRAEAGGRAAETACAWLLRCKGYRVVARRVRTPVGEIDLVARRGRVVAFVEVKRRASTAAALEAVTARGRARIAGAAGWWLARNPAYDGYTMRFDVVVLAPRALPRHVKDAFGTNG